METKKWTYVDKSDWGDGPWQHEPDKMQWQCPETGLPCLVVRGPFGALCGYVGVTREHPDYEKSYNDVDVSVHGGLTFAGKCQPGKEEQGICHIVSEGEDDDVFWFGFDCAHAGDFAPGQEATLRRLMPGFEREFDFPDDVYAALPYVQMQVYELAKQLKERAK